MAKAHAIITALVNDPDKDLSELIPPKTLPTLASKSAKIPVKATVASSLPVTSTTTTTSMVKSIAKLATTTVNRWDILPNLAYQSPKRSVSTSAGSTGAVRQLFLGTDVSSATPPPPLASIDTSSSGGNSKTSSLGPIGSRTSKTDAPRVSEAQAPEAVPCTAAVPSVATTSQAFSLFDNVNEVSHSHLVTFRSPAVTSSPLELSKVPPLQCCPNILKCMQEKKFQIYCNFFVQQNFDFMSWKP